MVCGGKHSTSERPERASENVMRLALEVSPSATSRSYSTLEDGPPTSSGWYRLNQVVFICHQGVTTKGYIFQRKEAPNRPLSFKRDVDINIPKGFCLVMNNNLSSGFLVDRSMKGLPYNEVQDLVFGWVC